MSKEAKVGFLGLVILCTTIFVFTYMKRHNAFSTNVVITAHFDDVEFLKKGDPVLIKGREYGTVSAIYMIDGQRMVDMDIEEANIPSSAKAVITELSLLGGRSINIVYTGKCTNDCLQSGDVIPGEVNCMKNQAEAFAKPLLEKFGTIVDTLMGPNGMESMIAQAHSSLAGLSKTTKNLENKMRGMSRTLPGTIKGFRDMTGDYLQTDKEKIASAVVNNVGDEKMQFAIDSLMQNVASLTQEDIDAMTKILYTLAEESKKLPDKIEKGKTILVKADKGLDKLNKKNATFEEGAEGTIPKMLYDGDYKDSLVDKIRTIAIKINTIKEHPEENITLTKKKK